jgi:uncharacterized protein YhfF
VTSCAPETFRLGDSPALVPGVGKRMAATDGPGRPRRVIGTAEFTRSRFDEVDAAFARDEGERGLAARRGNHRIRSGRLRGHAPDMPSWCGRFRAVETIEEGA